MSEWPLGCRFGLHDTIDGDCPKCGYRWLDPSTWPPTRWRCRLGLHVWDRKPWPKQRTEDGRIRYHCRYCNAEETR